ncbi:MAG: hypothetical protein ACK5TQ_11260, partial [Acetobacteraceae bacterium]
MRRNIRRQSLIQARGPPEAHVEQRTIREGISAREPFLALKRLVHHAKALFVNFFAPGLHR